MHTNRRKKSGPVALSGPEGSEAHRTAAWPASTFLLVISGFQQVNQGTALS